MDCKRCSQLLIQSKVYAYKYKNSHKVYLCWKCGGYDIIPDIKDNFTNWLFLNPLMILDLIETGELEKIEIPSL